jgi:hypothetical protein
MRKITLGAAAALLAGSALAAAGLPGGPVPARPALAQEEAAFVQWQSPDEGARLSGSTVHIKAKVGYHGGVRSWAVEVVAPEGEDYPGYGTVCEKSESRSPAYVNIDCVWDTTAYPDEGGPAQNRPYIVRITTHGNAQSGAFSDGRAPGPHTDERGVTVSNPVSPPRDVRLGFVDSTKQATIRWAANPEPDIVSYVVQERVGDGPWKNVGQAGGKVTTFTRNLSAPGTYRYQVAALRSAGSGTDTIQSAWSAPAAEPKQIVVAEPKRPEPTTTTTLPPYSADAAGETGPPGSPAPGDPAAPVPSTAASPNPGDPAAPGAPVPPGGTDLSRNGALVTPIQAGAPGSVKSGGATVGGAAGPVVKPGRPAPEPEEAPEGPDTGFSTQLPYKQSGESTEEADGDGVGRVLVGLPEAIGGDETRQLLVPLAAGLLLFVFAMHVLYVSRRAGQEAQALETE